MKTFQAEELVFDCKNNEFVHQIGLKSLVHLRSQNFERTIAKTQQIKTISVVVIHSED
jgi:hypothetical protein